MLVALQLQIKQKDWLKIITMRTERLINLTPFLFCAQSIVYCFNFCWWYSELWAYLHSLKKLALPRCSICLYSCIRLVKGATTYKVVFSVSTKYRVHILVYIVDTGLLRLYRNYRSQSLFEIQIFSQLRSGIPRERSLKSSLTFRSLKSEAMLFLYNG